jgi:uncharacterized protein (DUF1778 family)
VMRRRIRADRRRAIRDAAARKVTTTSEFVRRTLIEKLRNGEDAESQIAWKPDQYGRLNIKSA